MESGYDDPEMPGKVRNLKSTIGQHLLDYIKQKTQPDPHTENVS
ncbi:MAG TPA: hypothetical protein PLL64_01310 [Rhodothermales bacterium]|nr:hypothetical protein [Rhodothermales bacterium]HRR07221.1 hypothetical protein [Rhodothermales bacterium]